jgi:hypothetical protein
VHNAMTFACCSHETRQRILPVRGYACGLDTVETVAFPKAPKPTAAASWETGATVPGGLSARDEMV